MKHLFTIIMFSALLMLLSCGSQKDIKEQCRNLVFTGVPPAGYLAEKIGGEAVQVKVMLNPADNPHNFELTPQQVMDLAKARIYISSGLPFEQRLSEKIGGSMGHIDIVSADSGVERIMENGHHHHEEGEHIEGEVEEPGGEPDLHIWMSCGNLKIMAKNILDAYIKIWPEMAVEFTDNYDKLIEQITTADDSILGMLAEAKGRSFYVYHPAFGYFARDYGFTQEAVEIGGKNPSPKQLAEVIAKARRENVKTILVQPQFDRTSADKIAEAIGGKVLAVNSMDKDILANMVELAKVLSENK